MPMQSSGGKFSAAIPGDYTNSPYPMQYCFVLRGNNHASLYPGFNADLSNQPYYAIWKRNT